MISRYLLMILIGTVGLMAQSFTLTVAVALATQETASETIRHSEVRTIQLLCAKKPKMDEEINLRAQAILKACDQVCIVYQRKDRKVEIRDLLPLASVQKARWDAKTTRYIVDVKIQGALKMAAAKLPEGAITGVVVDCRELSLKPCMSPHIVRVDGSEVWGDTEADFERVIGSGIAGWSKSEADLLQPDIQKRIGNNPMTLKAIAIQGSGNCNAVLADEDAELLLRENSRWKFLERFAVVFLY